VASRRRGKDRRELFGADPEDLSPSEAADLIYGDPVLLDEVERQRVIRRPVSLGEITEDPAIQVRVGGLDPDHLELLVQVLLNGGSFDDPIELVRDDESGALLLAAGFHRCAATRIALERADELVPITDKLDARIHQMGGRALALEIAEEDNLRHGLKLTRKDKFNIFERRLTREHEWAQWSDRRLAAELGVSHTTISRWRAELHQAMTGTNVPVAGPERVGADGRVYDVSGIQDANQARQQAETESPGSLSKNLNKLEAESPTSPVTITSENESGACDQDGEVFQNLENLQDDADAHVRQLVDQVRALAEAAVQVATTIEGYLPLDEAKDDTLRDLRGHINDALDYLYGYKDTRRQWRAGAAELLERVRRDLGDSDVNR
jgi:predicted heme/steroid binding protein